MSLVLRDGLLEGVAVVVAGVGEPEGDVAATATRLAELGARVRPLRIDPAAEAPQPADPVAVLVWDGAGAAASAPGVAGVHAALDGAWVAVRAVTAGDLWPSRLLLLAPRPDDAHRAAARAGLENLARTLGVEWARFGVRTVAILPGAGTAPGEVAELAGYLASPAGDYCTGTAVALHPG